MKIRWIPLLLLCFLISCASTQPVQDEKQGAKPPDIPSPVSFQADREQKVVTKQADDLYSFSLREADVKDILRAIAKQTDCNVVIEPDVRGTTTVDLKEVTLPKALEYILEPLNYAFKIEGRTVYVSKPKVETKLFTINYLALKKSSTSRVQWREGSSSSTTTGASTTSAQDRTIDIRSESETDLWKNLEDNLKAILSADGKSTINKQAFTIMVLDYPKNLKQVALFLDSLEAPMHRQIMIEAKIVEVILAAGSRVGVNWSMVNARIGGFARISATQTFPVPTDFSMTGNTIKFSVGSPSGTTGSPGDLDIASTFIEALQKDYKIEVLSSPKVATLNNQRAVIKSTTQEVYFDQTQSNTTSGTLATYTPKFLNTGVALDVIPQIDENANIILSIHPVYSYVSATVPYPKQTGDLVETTVGVPVITTREADTIVRVKDGETVVIAGLIQEKKFKDRTGVFGLANIPLLGPLFRADTEEKRNTELVVFLTPRIIHEK